MIPEASPDTTPRKRAARRPHVKRVKPHSTLAAWRKAQGFTQHEAADHLGVSQGYYCKLELKTAHPRKGWLKTLTERTGVPVDELMGIAS